MSLSLSALFQKVFSFARCCAWGAAVLLCTWLWACSTPVVDPPNDSDGGSNTDGGGNNKGRKATQLAMEWPKEGKWTQDNFYSFPWPSDLRLDADGSPALSALPLPKRTRKCTVPNSAIPMIKNILESIDPDNFVRDKIKQIDKFSQKAGLYSAAYLRFSRTLDEDSLPSPSKSMKADTSVFLMDIDPKSPKRGERVPLWLNAGFKTRFFPAPLVVARPYEGFPLRANTTYALVFTNRVRDIDGEALAPMANYKALSSSTALKDPVQEKLRKLYQPMYAYLQKEHKLAPVDIVAATVFTTGDPLAPLRQIHKQLDSIKPKAPVKINCFNPGNQFPFYRCNGEFETPQFQKGNPPFLDETTGFFEKDDKGQYKYKMVKLRFVLTLPQKVFDDKGDKPEVPVVMYAHGTGGDYETPIQNATASRLAALGIAVISMDQPIHGKRSNFPGNTDVSVLFFNPLNLLAARDNIRQAAIDYLWLRKFTAQLKVNYLKKELRFPTKKIWYMGHSQGALVGGVMLGVDQSLPAAFLSAPSGALINTFVPAPNRPASHPNNFTPYIDYLFCDNKDTPVNYYHPLPNLLQHLLDGADPMNYAPWMLRKDRKQALNLLMVQGIEDNYTPPQVFRPFVTASQVPRLGPNYQNVPGIQLLGLDDLKLPATGNYSFDNGQKATIGFTQHKSCKRSNGSNCDQHFVSFNNKTAIKHWTSFFQSLLTSDVATVSE